MLVTNSGEWLDIPHEPGNKIRIRLLSGLEMDEASDIRSREVMKKYGAIGKEALAAFRGDELPQAPVQFEVDPTEEYDHKYLLVHAIEAWSGPNYESLQVSDATKADLDSITMKWLIGEIIKRNYVPLVKSPISEE